jgi:hypothetical protein
VILTVILVERTVGQLYTYFVEPARGVMPGGPFPVGAARFQGKYAESEIIGL